MKKKKKNTNRTLVVETQERAETNTKVASRLWSYSYNIIVTVNQLRTPTN